MPEITLPTAEKQVEIMEKVNLNGYSSIEAYKNLNIDSENAFITVYEVGGKGYLSKVLFNPVGSNGTLRVYVDNAIYWEITKSGTNWYGMVNENFAFLDATDKLTCFVENRKIQPTLDTVSTSKSRLIQQNIFFENSLKIEVLRMGGNTSFNFALSGGIM